MTGGDRLTSATFLERLRGLNLAEFRAFVADLWRAEGWTIDRDDGPLVVSRSDRSGERHIRVAADDRSAPLRWIGRSPQPPTDECDLLVVAWRSDPDGMGTSGADGPRVIDADDLYERLRYAIDRSSCERLCRDHLGIDASPARSASDVASSGSVLAGTLIDVDRPAGTSIAVVVMVSVLIATAVIGSGGAGPRLLGGGAPPTSAATDVSHHPSGPIDQGPLNSSTAVQCAPSMTAGVDGFLRAMRASEANDTESFRSAWERTDPSTRGPYDAFVANATTARFEPMLGYENATIREVETVHRLSPIEDTRESEVTLVANDTRYWYRFHLSRYDPEIITLDSRIAAAAPFKAFQAMHSNATGDTGCWLVSAIVPNRTVWVGIAESADPPRLP